jgi:cystathionine gamma-synthase
MTHASAAGSALEVPGDLIRLSVGIEDCDDLIDDLRQAFEVPAR